jgi:predicted transcriptional regulator
MSKNSLSAEQTRFIEDVVALMVPWGMPQMSARIYAYLLLHAQSVSLDQITDDLEVSKSTASVAARLLENHMLIRRQSERGTKRVLYVASDSSAGLLTEKSYLLGEFGKLLEARAESVAPGDAATRMRAIGRFYLTVREALEILVKDLTVGGDGRPLPGLELIDDQQADTGT